MNKFHYPDTVIVELTNKCNLKCPLCSTFRAMKREYGFMSFDLYRALIDELKAASSLPEIAFTMCGEPLLHPQSSDFIQYAASNNFHTCLSTNATCLTRSLSARILCSGLSKIFLCLDGFSKKSHESYRVGSDFDAVKQQCEEFLRLRNETKNARLTTIIQTLVTSLNQGELQDIEAWARQNGADKVYFKTLSLGSHLSEPEQNPYKYLLPDSSEFRRVNFETEATCQRPAHQTMIYWNGDVGLCCIDYNNEFTLGNISQGGLINVLNSAYVQGVRNKGQHRKHELCRRCQATLSVPGQFIDL